MRIYKAYATDEDWSYWDVSEDAVLAYIAKEHTGELPKLRERENESTAYFEVSEYGEFCVEWFDIELTPAALVNFLNEHAS